ncbi:MULTISPECIES: DUF4326 domain-containing protein [Streptomyces]|uniref:DUF4326 domain-containing protein n=1 Tax=Streptomyces muensis TaxID=1077944 RepID=A0A9X1PRY8_STRM4|nr:MULTISPECIES: DUF4326 domain-containing protein [Streptomyces]MCF1592412.1 DUF4326 domain-containing protein [Streptomyces muensis]QKV98200.1 DUF4326 domain-containing protein [Streptomyces sp. NA02950]
MSTPALPVRRKRERTEGWRKGDGVIVDRTTRDFGNPFTLDWAYTLKLAERGDRAKAHEAVVDLYRKWLAGDRTYFNDAEYDLQRDRVLDRLEELRGKDLICPCELGLACHADVLMQWANADPAETARYVTLARRRVDRSRARRGETPLQHLRDAA